MLEPALHFFQEATAKIPRVEDVKVDHLRHLWHYMHRVLDSSGPTNDRFDVSQLQETSAQAIMLKRMGLALSDILRGDVDPLSLMTEDNLLYQYYSGDWVDYHYKQMAAYVRQFAHKAPGMKILEIGAGTGGTTVALLPHFPVRQGFTYDFHRHFQWILPQSKRAIAELEWLDQLQKTRHRKRSYRAGV